MGKNGENSGGLSGRREQRDTFKTKQFFLKICAKIQKYEEEEVNGFNGGGGGCHF